MSKIHYITNCKSELANDGKERMAEEIRTTLNDIRYVDEIDDYNEEEMVEQPSTDDNTKQIPSQELEILNILDLDLMFENKSVTNRQLEIDELDNFIHEFLLITAEIKPLRILDIGFQKNFFQL
ncbi:hypothetical protein RhiirA4_473709 [Rhizophagus irregularis]|uniref:Uncharacterized protein n=1 Tax=Rhizophagus irregularis TaxID=588596 RepID=A0A2I1H799_9GLOM|nr:hypothetical protein RhiirA4_473709 [Rhizophagus irregularis]